MLRSDKFNDVYFSADGGVEETKYVFLDGNNLPQAWGGVDKFVIAETGFGTGLNFLCTWKLFEETANTNQRLHFISVEKYPLSKSEIKSALSQWSDSFSSYLDTYLSLYPLRIPGPHHIHITERVSLTLWFGGINDVLPEWNGQVDAWFLDGFTPAKNPDMWSAHVFENMARLSHEHTTYATFTAAGDVRRGLEASGFSVEKAKGFGRKRDMIKGCFNKGVSRKRQSAMKSIAIIGGGLAGCSVAYLASQKGFDVTIYEAGDILASGASGGRLGMVNPQLMAKPSPQATYYGSAYAHALRLYSKMEGVNFNIHGSTYICLDDDKDRRFRGYIENLGWHSDHIQRDDMDLFYPNGASVSPQKLCHFMARDAKVNLSACIKDSKDLDEDIVVIANGYQAKGFLDGELPIYSVRGQVSWIKERRDIDKNICFGGYITPKTSDGFHVLGSTFERYDERVDVRECDHEENVEKYNNQFNENIGISDVVGGWAGVRASAKDYFPIVGSMDDRTYISTAHGSHGLISSVMAADIILAQVEGDAIPASRDVLKALNPKRFHKR